MNSVNSQNKISEKQIQINDLNISYKQIGNGKIPIVLLHGWGVSGDKYVELARWLYSPVEAGTMEPTSFKIQNSKFKILIPDLPGFGKSDEPNESWNLDDYVEFVDKFIDSVNRNKKGFELVKNILKNFDPKKAVYIEKRKKPILIGHSFGGQIAIKYAIKYPKKIDKLILTGAVGIRHKLNKKQKIFFFLAKSGKIIFSLPVINKFQKLAQKILYKLAREKDYHQATTKMKEIMKNVLAEDLTDCLSKIKISTLLVWGKLDNSTPLFDGKLMNEKIENSELVVVNDANHSLPYQKAEEFSRIVADFIKKDR